MSESNGAIPPLNSKTSPNPSSPAPSPFDQVETGMSKAYAIKGDTAVRNWAKKSYPQMTDHQLDTFVRRFLSTLMSQIGQQIKKEMERAREEARKLKRSEEGED